MRGHASLVRVVVPHHESKRLRRLQWIEAGSGSTLEVAVAIHVAAERRRSRDHLSIGSRSLDKRVIDGLEEYVVGVVFIGEPAVDIVERARRRIRRDWEGQLRFLVERRHARSRDLHAAAEVDSWPTRQLREGGLVEQGELERGALAESALRNDDGCSARTGDGAAARTNGGRAIRRDKLADREGGLVALGIGQGHLQRIVDGGRHLP